MKCEYCNHSAAKHTTGGCVSLATPLPTSLFDIPGLEVPPYLFHEDCDCKKNWSEVKIGE